VSPVQRLLTADGVELEAEVDVPDTATVAVVLAHPHPLYGGSMRGGLPAALFDWLPTQGVGAVRFNFRGVEGSGGEHDRGGAERLDVAAAVAAVDLPVVVCGWSFGGDVSLCVTDERIAGWCPVAPPLAIVAPGDMAAAADSRRKLVLVPEHDQYSSPARTAEVTAAWSNTTIEVVPGTDHFLGGALRGIGDAVLGFARS
jgi:alpha/beta superfamily hydrolase